MWSVVGGDVGLNLGEWGDGRWEMGSLKSHSLKGGFKLLSDVYGGCLRAFGKCRFELSAFLVREKSSIGVRSRIPIF